MAVEEKDGADMRDIQTDTWTDTDTNRDTQTDGHIDRYTDRHKGNQRYMFTPSPAEINNAITRQFDNLKRQDRNVSTKSHK